MNQEIINFLAINSNDETISGSLGCSSEMAEEILSKQYVKFKILSNNEMELLDQEYLAAYDINKKSLKINLDKAKYIKKDLIRSQRAELLKKLDVEFILALESNDSKAKSKIVEEKNRLRDLPAAVDKLKTLEEIKELKV